MKFAIIMIVLAVVKSGDFDFVFFKKFQVKDIVLKINCPGISNQKFSQVECGKPGSKFECTYEKSNPIVDYFKVKGIDNKENNPEPLINFPKTLEYLKDHGLTVSTHSFNIQMKKENFSTHELWCSSDKDNLSIVYSFTIFDDKDKSVLAIFKINYTIKSNFANIVSSFKEIEGVVTINDNCYPKNKKLRKK